MLPSDCKQSHQSLPASAPIDPAAIAARFAYVALIMDAWSRRVVGYAIGIPLNAMSAKAAFFAWMALSELFFVLAKSRRPSARVRSFVSTLL